MPTKKTDPDFARIKEMINRDRPTRGAVRVDRENKRVSVESKSGRGIYVENRSSAPTHDNPRGSRGAGAGAVIRFGGSTKKKRK